MILFSNSFIFQLECEYHLNGSPETVYIYESNKSKLHYASLIPPPSKGVIQCMVKFIKEVDFHTA